MRAGSGSSGGRVGRARAGEGRSGDDQHEAGAAPARAPADRVGAVVADEDLVGMAAPFETLGLACLRKDPAERPASAAAVASLLVECAAAIGPWNSQHAEAWWNQYAPEVASAPA